MALPRYPRMVRTSLLIGIARVRIDRRHHARSCYSNIRDEVAKDR